MVVVCGGCGVAKRAILALTMTKHNKCRQKLLIKALQRGVHCKKRSFFLFSNVQALVVVCGGRRLSLVDEERTTKISTFLWRLSRGVSKGVFIASKALLADYFQSVQRGGDRALVVVCGGRAVVYHGNYLR